MNALLRARRRALDSGSAAEADEIRTRLQDSGVLVRDRDGSQQYRRLRGTSAEAHDPPRPGT